MNIDEIRLVTWDVDGTLYSLRRMKWFVLLKYLKETIKGNGAFARENLAALRRYRGMIDRARAEGGLLSDSFRDEVDFSYFEAATHRWYVEAIAKSGPRSGVKEVLISLRNRGLPLVVFSDYVAESKLKVLGLAEYFDGVYAGERLGFVKPHPALLERIAADFSVRIETVLHIGDRVERDEAAARAAGCQCLILGRDFRNFESLWQTVSTVTRQRRV
ncbi:MAG TPA: HAD family hydrolase [Pyrinomonadaceae bacterium]